MTLADLTPDALAKLEAKLLSDLEMVRKVRALLLEHEGTRAAPSPPSPSPAATSGLLTFRPTKSREACIQEALAALPGDTFRPDALRRTLVKAGMSPSNTQLRALLSNLIAKGTISIEQIGRGRPGSLYRRRQLAVETPVTPDETRISPTEVMQ